jgi:hypothetical protein
LLVSDRGVIARQRHRKLDPALERSSELESVEKLVTEGDLQIAAQRVLIARLYIAGYDAAAAEELLRDLEEAQAKLVAERDRLARELRG